jgi:hypothetical protein
MVKATSSLPSKLVPESTGTRDSKPEKEGRTMEIIVLTIALLVVIHRVTR